MCENDNVERRIEIITADNWSCTEKSVTVLSGEKKKAVLNKSVERQLKEKRSVLKYQSRNRYKLNSSIAFYSEEFWTLFLQETWVLY